MGSYPGVLSQSVHSRLDQVVCFARDLEVFILKVVSGTGNLGFVRRMAGCLASARG